MCLTCCCVSLTGSVVAQRSDHGTSAPPMLQAAASAAGAPLVASPYPQSYLQYNPPQYGQQQVIQAMAPYAGQVKKKKDKSPCFLSYLKDCLNFSTCRRSSMHHQFPPLFSQVQPMYSMLQGGARMLGQGGGPHPQALGPPGGPQFPSQGDAPQGPQQGIYGEPNASSTAFLSY